VPDAVNSDADARSRSPHLQSPHASKYAKGQNDNSADPLKYDALIRAGINILTQIKNSVCNTVWDDLKKTGVLNTSQPPESQ